MSSIRMPALCCAALSLSLALPLGCTDAADPDPSPSGASSPAAAPGELRAFTSARIVTEPGEPPIESAVLLVRAGRVDAVGSAADVAIPDGAERVDLAGKTLVPGLINAHGHVGGVRGLESSAEHYTTENLQAQLGLYARYGVTSVFSLGGDGPEGVALREAQDAELERARLFVAGRVVNAADPETAREQVRAVAASGADWVKIRVDDRLGQTTKIPPEVYTAAIEEAHAQQLPVAVHIFALEDALGVLQAGADLIAHSVRDRAVTRELIDQLRGREVCVVPTLAREVSTFIYATRPPFFDDPFFLREADPAVLEQLSDPERQRRVAESPAAATYREALRTAQSNLEILRDARVGIAFGTDSGPPGRFQGYFEHLELELMAEAGLTPTEILRSATTEAARCMGQADAIGSLRPGRWADFVAVDADPLADIRNLRRIDSVWIAGNRVPGGS